LQLQILGLRLQAVIYQGWGVGGITFAAFTGITLDGTQKTSTADWAIADVVDPRETGDGWKVVLMLTQLKEYNTETSEYVAEGNALATSSVKVTAVPVVSDADPAGRT